MKFVEFVETFFDVCAMRKNSAGELAQKRMALENHLLPFFGELDLDSIGKPEIRRYMKMKQNEGYADKTINNHLLVLSRYLNVAREERALTAPKFKVEQIPLEFHEARYLSAGECKRLVQSADIEEAHIKAMVIVALFTGLRVGELIALAWEDVDLRARKVHVHRSFCRESGKLKAPKGGRNRDVFLNDKAAKALIDMGPPTSRGKFVFNVTYSVAYDAMIRIAHRAGLEDVGWHTLRHTFASFLVLEGTPLFTVSRLLGHSSVRITERYAHLNDEKNKDAVGCLAAAMGV